MGIQMALIITMCALGAVQLDKYLSTAPVFTVIGSLVGVGLSMYVFIKQIIVENNQEGE
ncbi:MAG: AtpZ/AtpI family protein [Aureispira sp.]|nr:AtpZ/AtpI family protein [Aureispira sp.]